MSTESNNQREERISRDRETIRAWAGEHDAVPVQESTGRVRLVHRDEVSDSQDRLEWDRFHDELHDGDYVVIYHGAEADEPFEIAGHGDVATRVDDQDVQNRLMEGETVTSEITETSVVETEVVEEMDVESELVNTEIIDHHVVDVELMGRECSNCEIVDDSAIEDRDEFDANRYLSQFDEGNSPSEQPESTEIDVDDIPYHLEADVEDTWTVTRELTERFTVESHITGIEVTGVDTIEDHQINVQGLHRSIVESGLFHGDRSADRILSRSDVESELTETDTVTTTFTAERVVEDEVVNRNHLRTQVTGGESLGMETLHTQEIVTETDASDEGVGVGAESPGRADVAGSTAESAGTVSLTEDTVGKPVVNASGKKMGMVSDVETDEHLLYIDVEPGLTDQIRSALGWGSAQEEDYAIGADKVRRITDDEVQLKDH